MDMMTPRHSVFGKLSRDTPQPFAINRKPTNTPTEGIYKAFNVLTPLKYSTIQYSTIQ